MKAITLLQPQKIVFGTGCIETLVNDYKTLGFQKLFVLTSSSYPPTDRGAIRGVAQQRCPD